MSSELNSFPDLPSQDCFGQQLQWDDILAAPSLVITVRYRTWIEFRDDTISHSHSGMGVGRIELSVRVSQQGLSPDDKAFFQHVRGGMIRSGASLGSADPKVFLDGQAYEAISQVLMDTFPGCFHTVLRVEPPSIKATGVDQFEWLMHQNSSPMVGDILEPTGADPAWEGWSNGTS